MSIQPNRVIHRIIEQVDQSDWPTLPGELLLSAERGQALRIFRVPIHARYATPLHFWVHALREELAAVGRRQDLASIACHAQGQKIVAADWFEELRTVGFGGRDWGLDPVDPAGLASALGLGDSEIGPFSVEVYRMLESPCRRSAVVAHEEWLMAHFWAHGGAPSWRRELVC